MAGEGEDDRCGRRLAGGGRGRLLHPKHVGDGGKEGADEEISGDCLEAKAGGFLRIFEPNLLGGGGCGNGETTCRNGDPESGLGDFHSKARRFC